MKSKLRTLSATELQQAKAWAAEIRQKQRTDEERKRLENKLEQYAPYPKQSEFHEAGARYSERLFMAGNQLGKTWAGAFEIAMHLTGRYPDWWKGKRFDEAVRFWCGGKDRLQHRDAAQTVLLGPPEEERLWGTGTIPKDSLTDTIRASGIRNAVDTIAVRHVTGGTSTLGFKSYDMDRQSWQGGTLHGLWFDEEPPEDIYLEGLTRTNKHGQFVFVTFTPLLGMSSVVTRFLMQEHESRHVTRMGLKDAGHYTDEQRAKIIESYPAHERKARIEGEPKMGSGAVFPVDEDHIACDPFPIPDWWPCVGGVDFGWDHPFAAVRLVHDRDADVVFVTHAFRQRETTPLIHCAAIKHWGNWFPYAWPHDGLQHDKGSGRQLKELYRENGLNITDAHATFDDERSNGLEAGVMEMLERMMQGRLKVFRTLNEWFEEFRMYHRKDGIIVKERDDLMSATRVGLMMLRHAQSKTAAPVMDRYAKRNSRSGSSGWAA